MRQPAPDNTHADPSALNKALVDELKEKKWIETPGVEAAFRSVLRHHFLPGRPLELVYSDRAISAKQDEEGQWLSSSSQPAMMAIMLEQLGLEPGHKVLEIGAGTGYNAALMAHVVGKTGQVITVDIDEDLVETARQNLARAGLERVRVVCADGGYGVPEAAPFDRIILTVGAPDVTPAWWEQLKPDGRIVLPLMFKGTMKSIAFERAEDHLASLSVKDCGFIQLRGDFAAADSNRVQIGPDPDLFLETVSEFDIDSETAYDLLSGPSKDWAAGVEVTFWEALIGNSWTWLALHEPRMCKLTAKGETAEQGLVPYLLGIARKQNSMTTAILVGETELAALTRPPDQAIELVPAEKLFDSVVPFALYVRQFGPDDSLAHGLLAQIRAWDTAGRPSFETLRIRAYPKDTAYVPADGELQIEKQWTKLIVDWSASPSSTTG
jgi:protein-L-isoaspartate(D-aspartate) O-methyltransferase